MRRFLGPSSSISSDFHRLRFVAYPLRRKGRTMNKKAAWLVALLFLAAGTLAQGQQTKKVPRIGYLSGNSPASESARTETLRQGLLELGYVEGKNIVIEWRYAEGKLDHLSALAADLV